MTVIQFFLQKYPNGLAEANRNLSLIEAGKRRPRRQIYHEEGDLWEIGLEPERHTQDVEVAPAQIEGAGG